MKMKVSLYKKKQQKSRMLKKPHQNDDEQFQQNQYNSQNQPNDFQANIILCTVLLIFGGVGLYIYAIVSINSHIDNPQIIEEKNVSKFLTNLRDNKQDSLDYLRPPQIGASSQKTYTKFNIQYGQLFRKLTTQISIAKLERARQFFNNITAPIDQQLYQQQRLQFQRDYQIFKYDQKPICIVIPTYNNVEQDRFKKNIDSITQQEYQNYRVLVVDDCSSDGTSQQLHDYLKDNHEYRNGKIKIQRNKERKMALANILDAARNFCQPQDIFMIIDGDDYLLGKFVFKLFNAAFTHSDAWVVYSNFLTVNSKIGYSRRYPAEIIQKNYFRKVLFVISHLRAFYTKLLLMVKDQDLKDEKGQYFHAANDVAILMPILEMGRQHIQYIPQINYYYNSNTGHNNHLQKKIQQVQNDHYIRSKPQYQKINALFTSDNK